MNNHIDYIIKNPEGMYLARESFDDRWTETLADAYIFHVLNEAEERRDAGDLDKSEVYQLNSAQKHVPRAYSYDVTIRISAMSEEAAQRTLRKMSETLESSFNWSLDQKVGNFVRMDHKGEPVYGFEYDEYGEEIPDE